ncbi:MAG: hypothetical protein ACOX6M_04720 [Armatimonadota bacterium]
MRVLSDLRMEVPALEARVVCARLTAQAEGVSKPLIAVRDRACAVGAKMAEMEARIGLAQWGPSDARSEEASQALALARGMKQPRRLDPGPRSIVVDHTSDPNEQSGLLAEAVDLHGAA